MIKHLDSTILLLFSCYKLHPATIFELWGILSISFADLESQGRFEGETNVFFMGSQNAVSMKEHGVHFLASFQTFPHDVHLLRYEKWECTHLLYSKWQNSLVPRPCGRRKDGLVSTACACASIPRKTGNPCTFLNGRQNRLVYIRLASVLSKTAS